METVERRRTASRWPGVLAGVVAAAVLFGTAQLAAAFFGPAAMPLAAVGSTFIDFTPPWLKDFAIATFGTADKLVLFIAMGVVAALLAGLAGLLARRRWSLGAGLVVVLSVVIGACVATRSGASALDLVPTVLGTAAGLAALRLLAGRAAAADSAPADGGPESSQAVGRRRFLASAALLAGAAAVVGAGGSVLSGVRNAARAVREALRLPAAASPAAPLPAGVQAPVPGVVDFVTPNPQFYRIDTALIVPEVDPAGWSLRVHGMVEEEFTLRFQDLLEAELTEAYVTLTCVSNVVGGDLAGNAKWLGYPLRQVLARAKPLPGADMVLSTSIDGFSASTPLDVLQDDRDALLAIGMNGEPLPLEHGFPVRMVVPGLYGYVSATKWVVDLEVTRFQDKAAYWTTRGWSARGPVKTASRIEVPRPLARVPAGRVALGGTAWAQHRGISRVQVQLDNGGWRDAELAAEASVDTWRQWFYVWEDARPGSHQARVRAWDGRGELQTAEQAPPVPDGASGWHTLTFTVE